MKRFQVFILSLVLASNIFAQEFITENEATETSPKKKSEFWSRTSFGGIVGFTFGDYTSINLQPEMGYWFTDNWIAGGGIIYEYTSYKSYNTVYKSSIYGGKLFSQYFVWDDLYIMGILELVNLETRYYDIAGRYPNQERFWFASPLAGIGYMQRIGGKSGVSFSILFNLNNDRNSPYYYQSMPIIRIGFMI